MPETPTLVSSPAGWDQAFFAPVQWCTNGDCFDNSCGIQPGTSLASFVVTDCATNPATGIPWTIATVGPTMPSLGLPGTAGDTAPLTGVAVPQAPAEPQRSAGCSR